MSKFVKAIAAALGALGTGLVTAAAENGIEWGTEGWVILGGTLIAGAAVYRIPNSE